MNENKNIYIDEIIAEWKKIHQNQHIEGATADEIAEAWGVSRSTAKTRLQKLARLGKVEHELVIYLNDEGRFCRKTVYRIKKENKK